MSQSVETRPTLPPELKGVVNLDQATWVRVRRRQPLFRPLLAYMAKHASQSYEVDQVVAQGKQKEKVSLTVSGIAGERDEKHPLTELAVGLGVHTVQWEGKELYVVLQRVGVPVGTYDEAVVLEEFVIFAKGLKQQEILHSFVEWVFLQSQTNENDDTYCIYTWVVQEKWWKTAAVRRKRPLSSVVLPKETKDHILSDIRGFKSESTAEWYTSHGIPYKRSYLLYGPPGTGKTSFLAAIASEFDLNLCFLQAGHPMLTDDGFADALNAAPADSLLVLEDVDSLFAQDRKSENKSAMSFSGMLNSLDGCVSPHGQLFFLTTNHPERLDPAMLRHGRVDVRAEFPHATEAQVGDMFRSFYPEAKVEEVVAFVSSLKAEVGQMNLAKLQDFFIQARSKTADEACKWVSAWMKQQAEMLEAVKAFEAKNKAESKKKANELKGEDGGDEDGKVDNDNNAVAAAPAVTPVTVTEEPRQRSGKRHRRRHEEAGLGGVGGLLAVSMLTVAAVSLLMVARGPFRARE